MAGKLEPEAWSERVTAIVAEVRPRLSRIFKAYGIPLGYSEDLIQTALVALVSQWAEVRELAVWLIGTVRHQCRFYVRRQIVRRKAMAARAEVERLLKAAP